MRRLFEQDGLRFGEINVDKIPSDQFSYHLRQLAKHKLIEKMPNQTYRLSANGKTRAIMLRPDKSKFIEQGFVAVLVLAKKEENGRELFLVQKRNKVPYKGTLAVPGDKIYYGETTHEAAKRAFQLQTGLEATVELRSIWHIKDLYNAQIIQDKFFFAFLATNFQGEPAKTGITGENKWMTCEEIRRSDNLIHAAFEIIQSINSEGLSFYENTSDVDFY